MQHPRPVLAAEAAAPAVDARERHTHEVLLKPCSGGQTFPLFNKGGKAGGARGSRQADNLGPGTTNFPARWPALWH